MGGSVSSPVSCPQHGISSLISFLTSHTLTTRQTKEAIGIGHRHFVPTPNVRNPAMLQEATEYATAMHAFKNSLKTYEKRVMGE